MVTLDEMSDFADNECRFGVILIEHVRDYSTFEGWHVETSVSEYAPYSETEAKAEAARMRRYYGKLTEGEPEAGTGDAIWYTVEIKTLKTWSEAHREAEERAFRNLLTGPMVRALIRFKAEGEINDRQAEALIRRGHLLRYPDGTIQLTEDGETMLRRINYWGAETSIEQMAEALAGR